MVQEFYVANCSSLHQIENNIISASALTIKKNPLLKWNQTYYSTIKMVLSDVESSLLEDILTIYANTTKSLVVFFDDLVFTSNLSNTKLTNIRI